MSLAHGIRIGALGIALLTVAGWPDGADATVATTKAELPPFKFEIRTLSNRADLLSDGTPELTWALLPGEEAKARGITKLAFGSSCQP